MRYRVPAVTCAAILLAVFPLLTGCNDDCPDCPGSDPTPTMANIWPHADGNAWTYAGTYTEYPLPAGSGWADGQPLPMPSMEELHAALRSAPADTVTAQFEMVYRLAFDGDVVTGPGVAAQLLTGTVFMPLLTDGASPATPDALVRTIARARPDLRDRLAVRLQAGDGIAAWAPTPLFLGPGAFAYEGDGYFAYGELDTLHSWTYLQDSLEPGTEFSQQLVPAIADDIWQHGRVWSVGSLRVGGRTFANAVECMTVVDLGESMVTDETGAELGTFHAYMYGVVYYAPEVGPVALRQREVHQPGPSYPDGEAGMTEFVLDLAGATTAE